MTEYIGYKDATGEGLCNMGLTDEEIIRCRDCEHYQLCNEGFCICSRGWVVAYDEADGHDHKLRIEVEPDGYCAWAQRR